MAKQVVVLYGPPGSGKGTQADLIARKTDLVHFDTGRFLESLLYDPANRNDKILKKERKAFEDGKLLTPSWVLAQAIRETKKIYNLGRGIVYSGSPRTLFEAKKLLPLLRKIYGSKNVRVVILRIPDEFSIRRNSNRVVCSICKTPLLIQYYPSKNPKHCPICAGPFYKRTLDNPETIKVRLKEYRERTVPIFSFARKIGIRVTEIDGRPAPYKVFEKIYKAIKIA